METSTVAVKITDGQFYVLTGEWIEPPVFTGALVEASEGGAAVLCTTDWGTVPVTVEIHDSAPALAAGWERTAEAKLPSAGRVRIIELGGGVPDLPGLDVAPGSTVGVRVYARGGDKVGDQATDEYLVQLWPE
jgi:hypothetical protein